VPCPLIMVVSNVVTMLVLSQPQGQRNWSGREDTVYGEVDEETPYTLTGGSQEGRAVRAVPGGR